MVAYTRLKDDAIEHSLAHRFIEPWIGVSMLIQIRKGIDHRPKSSVALGLIERPANSLFRPSIDKQPERKTRNLVA